MAGDMLRRLAAAAKLPLVTTVVKAVMLVMRSIDHLITPLWGRPTPRRAAPARSSQARRAAPGPGRHRRRRAVQAARSPSGALQSFLQSSSLYLSRGQADA